MQAGNSSTHFFTEAVLDHFGGAVGARGRTWRQRFHVDSTHWAGAGAPVFLYIGGEGVRGPAAWPQAGAAANLVRGACA